MRPEDFYVDIVDPAPWGGTSRKLNIDLIEQIRIGPAAAHTDVEVAVALARLVHDDLERFGTAGEEELTELQMRAAILALRSALERVGFTDLEIPFRDYSTFRSWWIRKGASGTGGWQARRDLLAGVFDHIHDRLADLETKAMRSTLAESISPHGRTGWSTVDTEIGELRRHFQNARTPQDYSAVGNDCVRVTEALSREVYDPAKHLRDGETEPPPDNTKARLDRFVEHAATGPADATLRKLARASIEMAQHVKHSHTPTRREAGIAADAVIQLANLLRRLDEPS